jgi:hypothetical protein
MLKQEVRTFSSRWENGQLMYPGQYVLTWARVAGTGVWALVAMAPVGEAA